MFAGKRWSELAAQVMKGCACLVCVRLGPCAAWGMQARVERDRETERDRERGTVHGLPHAPVHASEWPQPLLETRTHTVRAMRSGPC